MLINKFNNYQSVNSNAELLNTKCDKTETDTMFNSLIGNAPQNVNYLKEFSDALANDSNSASNAQTHLEDKVGNEGFFATLEKYDNRFVSDQK